METGTEAAQFPEKEYINGIFVAVCVPIAQQAEQVVVLARLSPSLRLWFNTEGRGLGGRGCIWPLPTTAPKLEILSLFLFPL